MYLLFVYLIQKTVYNINNNKKLKKSEIKNKFKYKILYNFNLNI